MSRVSGEVSVFFNEDISHCDAEKILKVHDLSVIAWREITKVARVRVPVGEEDNYVIVLQSIQGVETVRPAQRSEVELWS